MNKKSQNGKAQIQKESDELREARKALADRKPLPTGEQVQTWFINDLKAAITTLHLVLESPDAMKDLVHAIYQEKVKEEQEIVRVLNERIQALEQVEQEFE